MAFANGSKPVTASSYSGPFPDMRGQFIRGMNAGASVDPTAGRIAVDAEADAFQGHKHTSLVVAPGTTGWYNAFTSASEGSSGNPPTTTDDIGISGGSVGGGYGVDGLLGTPRLASETRPKNVAVYWYIKVK